MAPINSKDWEAVLRLVDKSIQCEEGAALSIVRGLYQRGNRSGVRDIHGDRGRAHVHVEDGFIIKLEMVYPNGDTVFATRTSVAHHARLGHCPWWAAIPDGDGCNFATSCGCLPGAFETDYPVLSVTKCEEPCAPRRNERGRRVEELEAELASMRRRLGITSAELGEAQGELKLTRAKLRDARMQEVSTRAELGDTRRQLAKAGKRRNDAQGEGGPAAKKPKGETADETEEIRIISVEEFQAQSVVKVEEDSTADLKVENIAESTDPSTEENSLVVHPLRQEYQRYLRAFSQPARYLGLCLSGVAGTERAWAGRSSG